MLRNSRLHSIIAFLSGASLTLAFAPFEWRIISIISPAILFYLLHQVETTKQHLKLSYSFAFGMFGTGISWIFYSMYFFAQTNLLLAVGATLLFVALMSLVFLLLGLLTSRFTNSSNFLKLLVLYPASWVMIEWFRGWFLTGFPWLYLSHSHIDDLLINFAPVTGGFGVSLLSALLSGALVLLIIGNNKKRVVAITTIVIALIASFVLGKISWTQPIGDPIKVSLLQGNIPQERKWAPEMLMPTLELYQKLSSENWDSDLIIWPETAIPGHFREQMDSLILPLQVKSKETKTDLLIGGFYYNDAGEPGSENSILAITPDLRSIYSKEHLVPLGEYIPFLEHLRWLGKWIQLPYDSVKRGTGPTTLDVAGITAQMSVCYEDAYGNETIRSLPKATMLINVSNDGWFTGSIEPQQHMEIARMRAVETGRYMLRGTNIGVSGIIDQRGKIIHTKPAYTTAVIKGSAQPYSGATPYVKMGNWLIISIISVILAWAVWFYLPCSARRCHPK